jgi:hypothetical protein
MTLLLIVMLDISTGNYLLNKLVNLTLCSSILHGELKELNKMILSLCFQIASSPLNTILWPIVKLEEYHFSFCLIKDLSLYGF